MQESFWWCILGSVSVPSVLPVPLRFRGDIGETSKRDGVERIWAFPSAETENLALNKLSDERYKLYIGV